MNRFDYCVNVFIDLRRKIDSGIQYDLISTSGILRQLICDSFPVIPQAEKESGKTFQFWISFPNLEQSTQQTQDLFERFGVGSYQSVTLACSLDMGRPLHPLQIEDYRTMGVASINKELFTIEDIIEYVANKRGGVHLDMENLSDKQKRLHELSNQLSVQDQESIITQIRYIASNVLLSASISGYYSDLEVNEKAICSHLQVTNGLSTEEITSWIHYALFLQKKERFADAKEIYDKLIAHAANSNNKELRAILLIRLARLSYEQKNYRIAEHYCEKAITAYKDLGDVEKEAFAIALKGRVFVRLGDREKARSLYKIALAMFGAQKVEHLSRKIRSFIEELN